MPDYNYNVIEFICDNQFLVMTANFKYGIMKLNKISLTALNNNKISILKYLLLFFDVFYIFALPK